MYSYIFLSPRIYYSLYIMLMELVILFCVYRSSVSDDRFDYPRSELCKVKNITQALFPGVCYNALLDRDWHLYMIEDIEPALQRLWLPDAQIYITDSINTLMSTNSNNDTRDAIAAARKKLRNAVANVVAKVDYRMPRFQNRIVEILANCNKRCLPFEEAFSNMQEQMDHHGKNREALINLGRWNKYGRYDFKNVVKPLGELIIYMKDVYSHLDTIYKKLQP